MPKKSFFKEPSARQIQKRARVEVSPDELDLALDDIADNYILVRGIMVPETFDSHRKFVKHGLEIIARHPASQPATKAQKQFPYQAKREAVKKMQLNVDYAAWAFRPFALDRRKRRVLFTTDFEAAQIYAYAFQSGNPIKVKPYDQAKKVKQEGAEVFVTVPSRTKGKLRYRFKLLSFPVIDSPEKYVIAHNLGTNHSCPDVDFRIRYRYEDQAETSQVLNLDAHVGAGVLGAVDYYWVTEKNRVPLNCGQFDIPTVNALQFYKHLLNRVLIQETPKHKPRKLDRAEKNIAISDRLKRKQYNWMFFPTKAIKHQVNVRDYDWSFS